MPHSILYSIRFGSVIRRWVVFILISGLVQSAVVPAVAWSGYGPVSLANNESRPNAPVSVLGSSLPGIPTPTKDSSESFTVMPPPPSESERATRVARIKMNPAQEFTARPAETRVLAALPLDVHGNAVQGLIARWRSSDERVVTISEDGEAIAQRVGAAMLTATAGDVKESVRIRVVSAKQPESPKVEAVSTTQKMSSPHSVSLVKSHLATAPASALPDNQVDSIYISENTIGNPAGATETGAGGETAALRSIREKPGSANINFAVPLVNLPGRGLDVSLALTYNSRLWNKSTEGNLTYFNYGVDNNHQTLAPGFNLGYGYIDLIGYEQNGTERFSLTDANGTRHQLVRFPSGFYETVDGSFIQFSNSPSGGTLVYTDGTRVRLTAPSSSLNRRYPNRITDRNGNFIDISYLAGNEGRIDFIKDTMGRYVRFHYDSASNPLRLIAITTPKYNGTATDSQTVVRFYYERMTFPPKVRFQGGSSTLLPVDVIRYVYFPGTKVGCRYDYSIDYGMIRRITQLRRMSVSNETNLGQEGAVINLDQQQEAASTDYDYPNFAPPNGLLDVPKFVHRTDDWAGNLAGPAIYTYSVDDTSSTSVRYSTLTFPTVNGNQTRVINYIRKHVVNGQAQWDDGLVFQVDVIRVSDGGLFSRKALYWQPGPGGRNHRLTQMDYTNEVQETTSIIYGYDQFNNVTSVSERDFGAPAWGGIELRRTETTYVTSTNWTGRRLVRLPAEVVVKVGTVVAAKVKYSYDNDGADASLHLMPRSDLIMHDPAYNPANQMEPICIEYPNGQTICTPPNLGPRRGNITTIETFPNATAATGISREMKYDIAGNQVEVPLSCCQIKKITYNKAYEYAYPVASIRGNVGQLTTSATYDFNTGLTKATTDENGQMASYQYDPESLRPSRMDSPDGGYTRIEYFDELTADPDQNHLHSYIRSTTRLDAQGPEVTAMRFHDGRGALVRSFGPLTAEGHGGTTDIEYDVLGRVLRASNPYFAAGPATATNPTGYWTTMGYDEVSRVKITVLPDNTVTQNFFQGSVTTVTDQAGKKRRQKLDALGRVVRIDEPDPAGNLGPVGAPTQPSFYAYDALDNLTRVTQTDPNNVSQIREFKYDALSRLTHERQVEARATLDGQGQLAAGGNGQWTGVYRYDDWDLLTDMYDARGVHIQMTYDGLNRIKDVTYSDGTPKVTYAYGESEPSTYFNKGRLIEVRTDAVSANNGMPAIPQTIQAFDYDLMGHVVRQQQTINSQTYLLQYAYNQAGQLTSEQYPSGRVINYSVDVAGRLNGIADSNRTYAGNFTYSSNGGLLSSLTMGNGVVQAMSYSPQRSQLEHLSLTKDSRTIQQYDYKYGVVDSGTGAVDETKNTGQIARIESFISDQTGQPARQWQQRFSYDSLDRLAQAAEYRGDSLALTYRANYTHDRWGNRRQRQADNAQNLPGYVRVEDADIEKQTNRFAAATGIAYDDAGNITADPKFRQLQYRYDANRRQTRSLDVNGTGVAAVAVYDGSGQRVATQVNGQWRYMVYNINGLVVAEYGGQEPNSTGGLRYMMSDHQSSTRVVINASGTATARYDFQASGETVGAGVGLRTGEQGYGAPDSTRHLYAMTERDEATGLDHTPWRKYESRAGRWTTPDPYNGSMATGDPQSFNRYTYADNDPVNLIDPGGLQSCWGAECSWSSASAGFWGWGNLMNRPHGQIGIAGGADIPIGLFNIIAADFYSSHYYEDGVRFARGGVFISVLEGFDWPWSGYTPGGGGANNPQQPPDPYHVCRNDALNQLRTDLDAVPRDPNLNKKVLLGAAAGAAGGAQSKSIGGTIVGIVVGVVVVLKTDEWDMDAKSAPAFDKFFKKEKECEDKRQTSMSAPQQRLPQNTVHTTRGQFNLYSYQINAPGFRTVTIPVRPPGTNPYLP